MIATLAVPPRLTALADAQDGVLRRDQLARVGLGREHVRAAVRARRWQALGRNVVVLHNAPLTEAQRRWASVVLLPGKPAALAGLTAAAVAGLTGFPSERTHLLVAGNCAVALPPWVREHDSRRFSAADIQCSGGPPRTRVARSIIDAAAWSTAPRRACALACAAVQQRLTTAPALAAELRQAGQVRHVAILRAVLGDIGGGGHTLSELDLGPLARRAGLPAPRRQALRRERGGQVRYVDAEFDLPDGTVLAVEVDGAVHLRPSTWWKDMSRQNELVIGGSPMLRFDSVTMRLDREKVIDQLRRMRLAHS